MHHTTNTTLAQRLERHGFHREEDRYRLNGLTAGIDGRWLVFSTDPPTPLPQPDDGLQRPGLWKRVRGPNGLNRHEFHLPIPPAFSNEFWESEDDDAGDSFAELVEWVRTTASGKLTASWSPPPRGQLEEGIEAARFTMQAGSLVRHGQLVLETGRLAIQFQLVRNVLPGLPEARRGWLGCTLDAAQDRLRMVRIAEHQTTDGSTDILAEVDLSGAPHFLLPVLIRIGLDAARHAACRLVWSVSLLADPSVVATAWEAFPARTSSDETKRRRK